MDCADYNWQENQFGATKFDSINNIAIILIVFNPLNAHNYLIDVLGISCASLVTNIEVKIIILASLCQ